MAFCVPYAILPKKRWQHEKIGKNISTFFKLATIYLERDRNNIMKKIEKEIKVTRFIAFDNTEFETEEECISYEKSRFGALMQLLWDRVLSYGNIPSNTPYGTRYDKYYTIVQRSRSDVFNLNQILTLANSEDRASGSDENKLIVLCVRLECNAIVDARIVRTEELVKELSNGHFGVVSMIKPDEYKK